MCRLLKKYFVFIVGAFFVHFFWCWHLQQIEKMITVLLLKLKLPTIKLRRLLLIVSERLRDRLVRTTISMPLF